MRIKYDITLPLNQYFKSKPKPKIKPIHPSFFFHIIGGRIKQAQ